MFLSVKERARQIASGQFQPSAPVTSAASALIPPVEPPKVVPSKTVTAKWAPSKVTATPAPTTPSKSASKKTASPKIEAPKTPTSKTPPAKTTPPKTPTPSTPTPKASSSKPSSSKNTSSATASSSKTTAPKTSSSKTSSSKTSSSKTSSSKTSSSRSTSPKVASPKLPSPKSPKAASSKPVRSDILSKIGIGSFAQEPPEQDAEVNELKAACLKQASHITGLGGRHLAISLKQSSSSGEWYAALKDLSSDKYLKMWMDRSTTFPTKVEALEAYLVFVKKMKSDCRLFPPMSPKMGKSKP